MFTQELSTAWNALSKVQQRREWARFTEALDSGDAGYHRFYGVLAPMWDRGERP